MAKRQGTKTRFRGVRSLGDRRYLLRYQATNPKNGSYEDREKTIEDCPSPAKAAQIREELIREAEAGKSPQARTSLATFAASWLLGKKKLLKPATYDRYETTIDLHIVPHLGTYFIDAITHQDVVAWRDSFEGFKNSSVNGFLRVLKTMLKAATVELDLRKDPSQYVPALPEDDCGYDDERPNSLEAHELAAFLAATKEHRPAWYPLFSVLGFSGMRVSEATALKWIDVVDGTNGNLGKIIVRRSHWRGQVSATTKTKKIRIVPLPQELAAILHEHRRALEAQQHPGLEEGWVFPAKVVPGRSGKLIIHSSVRNALRHVLTKLEGTVPGFTIHGLRRTMNDLLRQHASKEIAKATLGHVTDKMHEHYSTVRLAEKSQGVGQVISLVRASADQKTGS